MVGQAAHLEDEEVEEDEGDVDHEGDEELEAAHHGARVLERRRQVLALLPRHPVPQGATYTSTTTNESYKYIVNLT